MIVAVEAVMRRRTDVFLVSRNPVVSSVKVLRIFAVFYEFAGSFAEVVIVNSTWTQHQIAVQKQIWYPLCDCSSLIQFSIDHRENIILSVGQYRPEKARGLMDDHPEYRDNRIRLIFIGGASSLGIDTLMWHILFQDYCEFLVNADYSVLLHYFSRASIGLHSMWNEYFGISVAAGVIPIAHNCGGPKSDIVTTDGPTRNGYLAHGEQEFASAMADVLALSESEKSKLTHSARESVRDRFSETNFKESFLRSLKTLFV
ncbi:hypothetical protein BJ742DRAFT_749461 [Cladochytrium replicatum]|nr:hypothetical protein BJ742DRAFT_749461 [Cladochytrium replicatum]